MQQHNITLISTVHKENGKCNSDELYKIIESIKPDVIFLEALEENYSGYDHKMFSDFGFYHKRLELKAIQLYSHNHTFEYIPVLDVGLSDEFDKVKDIITDNADCQGLIDNLVLLEKYSGFQFLNSRKSIALLEEMRELENRIVGNETMLQKSNASIDAYENSMLRNIYSFCKEKSFNTAIFMCGAAHRKSMVARIVEYEKVSDIKINWSFYGENN